MCQTYIAIKAFISPASPAVPARNSFNPFSAISAPPRETFYIYPIVGIAKGLSTTRCKELALLPGQPIEAPAADSAAMVIVIEFTLETVRDIVNMSETMFDQQLASFF